MLESLIAGVVIALVGAVVAFGLRRVERHLERQDTAFSRMRSDLDAIAGALRMYRGQDGLLYSGDRRRRVR